MGERFRIKREKLGNAENIAITVTKVLEAKELYWLREYEVREFDKCIVDLETGEIVLTVSTAIYDIEKEFNCEHKQE